MVEVEVRLDGMLIGGHSIPEAVQPSWLHGVLGFPDRIVDPAPPPPVGHRNNQIHVYDDLGLYFHEHHWTRLAQDLVFAFWPEEERHAFTPCRAFSGHLKLHDYLVPAGGIRVPIDPRLPHPVRGVPLGVLASRNRTILDRHGLKGSQAEVRRPQ